MQQYPQNTPRQFGQQPSYPQNASQQFGQQPSFPQNASPFGEQPSFPQNASQQLEQQPSFPRSTPPSGQPFPYQQNTPQQPGQRYQHNFTNKQMRHYFYKAPKAYLWLMIIGAIVLLFGIPASNLPGGGTFFFVVGLGLLAIGGIPFITYTTGRPTDEQYAKWVSERSQPLYNIALQRLHLDESQCERIIKVEGGISSLLQLTKKFPEKEITVKRLQDGSRHYSINVCMYIFLTKDDLAIYSGYINALTQNERFEDADHYYYKDIVGVSTSGPIYTSADGPFGKEMQRQGFFVRVNNGEVVGTDYATKVELGDATNKRQVQDVDEVVAALLVLLRDHNVTFAEGTKNAR